MNNYEILQNYSKSDLRRLAKGKIAEIVGLDAGKILSDLSRVLGNYESIKRNVEFRNPPADTILEVLLEADGHRIRVDELKNAVRERIRKYRHESKTIPIQDPGKGFMLYATMLAVAWNHDGDLVPAEANLLRVLRNELGITRRNHQLIMAHPDIGRLTFDATSFNDELTYLSNEGIVLVYCSDGDSYFVLSDETAGSLLQLWGFEMEPKQYERLLSSLPKTQLSQILRSSGLRTTGSLNDLTARILASEMPPSVALAALTSTDLAGLLNKLGLPRSGTKEERILRVTDHFKSDADIPEKPGEAVIKETPPETRTLKDDSFADLLDGLSNAQLTSILEALKLSRSGSKPARIERLVQSHFGVESILSALKLEDIRDHSEKLGLRRSGSKQDSIQGITVFHREREVYDSPLTPKDLLSIYEEIATQDRRAYPAEARAAGLSVSRIGLDFERATRYIFRNLLNLDTKPARPGREDPDGILIDDDGRFFCYECKTTLSPPYRLPIAHRLQIRNYISAIASTRRADQFGGYLIIAHSFGDDIESRLLAIEPGLNTPIAVISARDLLNVARKWHQKRAADTYPIGIVMRSGRISAKDFDAAAW